MTRRGRGSRNLLIFIAIILVACDAGPPDERRRGSRTKVDDLTDRTIPMDVRLPFQPPPAWQRVRLAEGVEFTQPPSFTVVNAPAMRCDPTTPRDTVPVLRTELSDRWPLTLAMRRGDLARIARANSFTIDSTDIAAHDQHAGDTTVVRRGEGWMLLSGRSAGTPVLLASVRAPNGCYLLWAGRGFDIDADTLGLVLGTVRFVADSAGSSPTDPPDASAGAGFDPGLVRNAVRASRVL